MGTFIFLIQSLILGDGHHQVQFFFPWHRACLGATLLFEHYPQSKCCKKPAQSNTHSCRWKLSVYTHDIMTLQLIYLLLTSPCRNTAMFSCNFLTCSGPDLNSWETSELH